MEKIRQNQKEYIVFLRALATIAVVFYHSKPSISSGGYIPRYLIEVFLNWCVPIFLMISGSLFLESEKTIDFKYMFKKTKHIFFIIFFWGFIYNILFVTYVERSISLKTIVTSVVMIFKGDTTYCFQFWYLYVILGIYMFMPFFKCWTDKYLKNENINKDTYLLVCFWLVFSIIVPTILRGINIERGPLFDSFTNVISSFLFITLCGRIFDVLNYKVKRILFLALSISFVIHALIFIYMIFVHKQENIKNWYGYETFFTLNMTSLLYMASMRINFEKIPLLIRKTYFVISKNSLFIYITHVIVLHIIRKIGFLNNVNPLIYSPLLVTITIIICLCVCYFVNKVNFLKRLF